MNVNSISPNMNNVKSNATSYELRNGGHACSTPAFCGAPRIFTIKNEKIQNAFKAMGDFSTPTNRLILGASALAIQPWIDSNNKDVDEETRKFSVAKTIAKIIVGTITGIAVRQFCINSMEKFTKTPEQIRNFSEKQKKIATALIPDSVTHTKFAEATRLMNKHRKALGSIAALGCMLFTNFLIDAPLTKILTNILKEKMNKSENRNNELKGGN